MDTYYPYDPTDPRPIVGESHKIIGGKILLRHIPTENSLAIDGFTEAKSIVNLQPDKFYCPYSKDTRYRESTRLVYFNTINDDKTVTCSYLAAGTPFTANDANEIKAHIENTAIHGGGGSVDMTEVNAAINTLRGEVNSSVDNLQVLIDAEQLAIDGLSVSVDERFANIKVSDPYVLPTASANIKGGVIIGNGLEMNGDTLNVKQTTFTLGTTPSTVEGAMWLTVG